MNARETLKIIAFQSSSLVMQTRILSKITKKQSSRMDIVATATATILLAAAALEAVLSEAAYILNPSLYAKKKFRKAGALDKFVQLKGSRSAMVEQLWNARISLTHAEPDHSRTRFIGEKLNAKGAEWASICIEELSKEIWGEEMPKWFADEAGIAP